MIDKRFYVGQAVEVVIDGVSHTGLIMSPDSGMEPEGEYLVQVIDLDVLEYERTYSNVPTFDVFKEEDISPKS